MLWGHDRAKRHRLEVEGLTNVRVFRVHMEELLLVGAEHDAVLTVPGERSEGDAGVVAFDHRHIHGVKLFDFIAPGVNEVCTATVAVSLIALAVHTFDELEGGQNGVKLDLLLGEDAEFVL